MYQTSLDVPQLSVPSHNYPGICMQQQKGKKKNNFFLPTKNLKMLACKSSGKVHKNKYGIHNIELWGRKDSDTKHFQAFAQNQILHTVQGHPYKAQQ